MNNPNFFTTHDASPEAAIAALQDFDGPLLLDLDETLYLRNSTEDFIDSARPSLAAALLLQLLEWLQPWRWSGGHATRDVWRVRSVMLLLPWTLLYWRRRVPQLAAQYRNTPLLEALRQRALRPVVVTLGFTPIVAPLIAALELDETRIVASRPSTFADRRRGKLVLAVDTLGADTVRSSLVLTDSADDLPLLNACLRPLRTIWPGARYRSALSDVYLPGRYLNRIKRPGERYIVRGILQEDFALWLLGSLALAAVPLLHAAGLLFLLLSFWTIYECGYVDNDRVAARFEADPKLSDAFHKLTVATPRWQPWIWAALSGGIALLLLRWPAMPVPADGIKWATVLLGTYGWFRLYNRFDKATRVWLFMGLQLARTAAFAVLVPVGAVTTMAMGAHVIGKWMPYYIYRLGGASWPKTPTALTRLLFFLTLAALLALTQGLATLGNGTTLALLAWMLYRAQDDLRAVLRKTRRLDHDTQAQ